jgi:hypothetical protein
MLMPAVPNASAGESFREQSPSIAAPTRPWLYAAAILAQFAIRLPFYATHHIQEDAYITFHSAFRWADAGVYSYNAGAHTPGVTSALYGPSVALLRLIFHAHAIAAVAVFNTIVVLAASWLLAAAFLPPGRKRFWAWMLIAASPPALLLSYCGMETALVICLIAALAFTVARIPDSPWTLVTFLIAPLVRPDAIGFSFFFLLALFGINRKRAIFATITTVAGLAIVFAIQRITTGSFLPATALAKEISNHPSHTISAIAHRLAIVYIHRSIFTPIDTKVLETFSVLFTLLAIALAWAVARSLSQKSARSTWAAVAASMLLIPAIYAVGGVLFPWYTWPCSWLSQSALVLVAALAYRRSNSRALRRTTIAALAFLWISSGALRWSVSFNDGTQLYHYRADVGRWLHNQSVPTDTLFLEPAGYIPYFAQLRTTDEVGLISPEILDYKRRFPADWWFQFVSQQQPTWLVERADMRHYETYQHQQLSPAQIAWFTQHYQLVREFHYDPAQYAQSPWQLRILEHGSHADFLVYRLRPQSPAQ